MTATAAHEMGEQEIHADIIDHAIGSLWLAAIAGAITIEDAERIDKGLRRAARRPPPVPDWVHIDSPTRHLGEPWPTPVPRS